MRELISDGIWLFLQPSSLTVLFALGNNRIVPYARFYIEKHPAVSKPDACQMEAATTRYVSSCYGELFSASLPTNDVVSEHRSPEEAILWCEQCFQSHFKKLPELLALCLLFNSSHMLSLRRNTRRVLSPPVSTQKKQKHKETPSQVSGESRAFCYLPFAIKALEEKVYRLLTKMVRLAAIIAVC